ncbi:MAG: IS200/IS605 family transposase [Bacteroidetes bacterium]|nr:IS200/IS605 family transposase [Bacteroidota bacterium]
MGNTYTKLHIQLIFAVKYRRALIQKSWKDELYKYITGIIQSEKHKLMIINGVEDHIHILIGYRPHQALSDLLKIIKMRSSTWINERKFTNSRFAWQEGFAAFSYSHSDLKRVIRYIENQEEHHKKKKFTDEYKSLLKAFDVDYDDKYILKEPE